MNPVVLIFDSCEEKFKNTFFFAFMPTSSTDYSAQQKIALRLSALFSPWRRPLVLILCPTVSAFALCGASVRTTACVCFTTTSVQPDLAMKESFLSVWGQWHPSVWSNLPPKVSRRGWGWKLIFSVEYLVSGSCCCAADSIDNVSNGSLVQTLDLISRTMCPYCPGSLVPHGGCLMWCGFLRFLRGQFV